MPTRTRRCESLLRLHRRRMRGCVLGLAIWFVTAAAWAHDPFEITAEARLRADALELVVTMARSTAMSVAAGGKEAPTFDPAEFEKMRPRFEACVAGLFEVSARGTVLALRQGKVTLSVENDVEFHLVFPRPAKGPVRFKATHVTTLPYGFGAALEVSAANGNVLGAKLLMAADPVLEVDAPATVATRTRP